MPFPSFISRWKRNSLAKKESAAEAIRETQESVAEQSSKSKTWSAWFNKTPVVHEVEEIIEGDSESSSVEQQATTSTSLDERLEIDCVNTEATELHHHDVVVHVKETGVERTDAESSEVALNPTNTDHEISSSEGSPKPAVEAGKNYSIIRYDTEEKPDFGYLLALDNDFDEFFPSDILFYIFSLLEFQDIFNVALVCKRWKEIAHDQRLWKQLFHSYFFYHESPLPVRDDEEMDWKEAFKQHSMPISLWNEGQLDRITLRAHRQKNENPNTYHTAVRAMYLEDNCLMSGSTGEVLEWDLGEEIWVGRTSEIIAEVERVYFTSEYCYAVSQFQIKAWHRSELYGVGKTILRFSSNYLFSVFCAPYFVLFNKEASTIAIYQHDEDIAAEAYKAEKLKRQQQTEEAKKPRHEEDSDDDSDDEEEDDEIPRDEVEVQNIHEDEQEEAKIGKAKRILLFTIPKQESVIVKIFINTERKQIIIVYRNGDIRIHSLIDGKVLRKMQTLGLKDEVNDTWEITHRIQKLKYDQSGLLCFVYRTKRINLKTRKTGYDVFISVYDTNRARFLVKGDQSVSAFYNGEISQVDIIGNFRTAVIAVCSKNQFGIWRIQGNNLLHCQTETVCDTLSNYALTSIASNNRSIAVGSCYGDITVYSRQAFNHRCCIM